LVPANTDEILKQRQKEKTIPLQDDTPETRFEVPKPESSVQLEQSQFHLNSLTVENANLLEEDEINEVIRPYENKDVTLDELQKVVEEINDLYQRKGFATSQAYIPPQDVQNGNVVIKVVEGKVGKFCVQGNKFNRPSAVSRLIQAEPGQPFDLRELEKDLNRTNRFNNMYRVRATLSPGEEAGETDVRVDVAERQPWQITPTFDNQGRPFIGYYRGGVELTNGSLFGYGDRFVAKYLGASGTQIFLGSYTIPVNRNGDELSINYGFSHVDVDLDAVNSPNITGRANSVGLLYSHPFDRDRVWVGDLGVNVRRISTEVSGAPDATDNIRSLQAGLNLNKYDKYGQTFARLQTSLGLDVFGGDNTSFWKNELFITRLFTLPRNNILMLRLYGMLSPNAMPTAEQMQIGGAYSVRGYTEGVLLGDRGINLTIEDRFPVPFLGRIAPTLAERLQMAAFVDFGHAVIDSSNTNFLNSGSASTTLLGAGFGLRARLSQYLQGFVDVGFGLLNRDSIEPNAQPTARVHFGVRSDLLPMVYKQRNDKTICAVNRNGDGRRSFEDNSRDGSAAPSQEAKSQTKVQAPPPKPIVKAPDTKKPLKAPSPQPDSLLPSKPQAPDAKKVVKAKLAAGVPPKQPPSSTRVVSYVPRLHDKLR
jgi:hemolysin activation/secretion protein